MFHRSKFNGNVSKLDVSAVVTMVLTFGDSEFEGDVSSWDRFSIVNDEKMFSNSAIAKKLGIASPSFDQVKSHFLNLKLEADLKDALHGQSQTSKVRL